MPFFLFRFRQKPCDRRAVDPHRTDGTEFLTAEAADAGVSVDPRLSLLHDDRLGRADLGAFATSDTAAPYGRAGGQHTPRDGRKDTLVKTVVSREGKAAANGYVLEIGNIVKCGTGAELLADDDIIKAYLGG